ncbi:olfactory receptor 11A1-like [Hemicordylus capensis]|uniref:olfactory receptor 11A1-like n=1 Tax=Hemicordylus capensis TaxID=884348 RepID=UPI00230357DA|nr:olfactory receptor 11A1-like [Hemicordylus capensis]
MANRMQSMRHTQEGNQTLATHFLLLGFGDLLGLQIIVFLIFLIIYIVTMAGNILIIVLVVSDQHLHTPMYFFLTNLSCLETCYSSAILPRMLASLLTGDRTISVGGCMIQFWVFGFLAATECYLLAVMSYDRYLAVCKPLHYVSLMNSHFCVQLVLVSWLSGSFIVTTILLIMSQLRFCAPCEIDHFFCDFLPLIQHLCSGAPLLILSGFITTSVLTIPPFLLTLTSYTYIITTILRIPSTGGRKKAFSTCSSHLTVVTIFYGTLIVVYMLPNTNRMNKIVSLFYTILTPLANPLIYSLRNKEVSKSLRRAISKCVRTQKLTTF